MTLNLPNLTDLPFLCLSSPPRLSRNRFLQTAHTAPSASTTESSTLFKAQLSAEVKKNQDITSLGKYNNLYKKGCGGGESHGILSNLKYRGILPACCLSILQPNESVCPALYKWYLCKNILVLAVKQLQKDITVVLTLNHYTQI